MSGIGYGGVVDYAPVTSATATREMAVTGMGDGGVCVGGPSLVLNFGVSPTGTTPTLDPRITFSRASNATYFDSTGTLRYAPHNLLTYSEQLDNAAWTKTQSTTAANSIAAPDGTITADKLVEDTTAASDHYTQSPIITPLANSSYAGSVYVKAAERRYIAVVVTGGGGATRGAFFDGQTGAYTGGFGGGLPYIVTDVGNGWFRYALTDTTTAAAAYALRVYVCAVANNINYTGDGTSGIYVWGAQINIGALQPYYSTTVKNLQGYTQEFNNAAWTKSAASVSADATAAPDGSFTADKLVEDGTSAGHYVTPAASNALTLNQIVTYSVYAKAAERTFIQLILTGINTASGNYVAGFDLSAGTAGTPTAGATASILAVGNGWYRCRLTVTVLTAATPTRQIRLALNANATASSYAGDGTSGAFIWGAQFSDSGSLDAYTYNPVAAPSAAAYYGPRIEYDPTTLAVKGLLIEEQRTNSLRNNTMQGAVAGTPGTLPTNWAFAGNAALSREIVSIGTDNGINYIDLRIFGTVAAVAFPEMNLLFESTSLAAASVSQSWTATNYVKVVGGSLAGILNGELFIIGYNSASGVTEASAAAFDYATLTGPLSAHRLSHTRTLTNAATVFVNSRIDVNFTAGGGTAVDVTLRIGLPQLEQGAFATSVIPTSTTALTRSADVVSMQGANFSNWYNPVEGTLFAEFGPYANGGATRNFGIVQMDDGTSNNMIRFFAGSTVSPVFQVTTATVTQAYLSSETIANTSVSKISGAYKTNDFARSVNNTATTTDLTGTVPPVTRMIFGMGSIGVNELNGYLRSFSYYPTRLPNAALRALTS